MQETWKQKLRPIYQNTPLFDVLWSLRGKAQKNSWLTANRDSPPPAAVKEQAIIELVTRFGPKILVETGTYRGDMLYMMRHRFRHLYSIELSPMFHSMAVRRFRAFPHIHPLLGDSGVVMGEVIASFEEPCLFWLDGHYSGDVTAKAMKDTPIVEELAAIGRHPIKNHVILIDDAHCFDGSHDYPTLVQLREIVGKHLPLHSYEVRDGMIRVLPA